MVTSFRHVVLIAWLMVASFGSLSAQEGLFRTTSGSVEFLSEAPLERIEAKSTALKGILNPVSREFAFTLPINSFEGFNSPLQQEHFNENYLESETHPKGQFSGAIIESIDLTQPGTYKVRAKGDLSIHGIAVERIIPIELMVGEGGMQVSASFIVPLADHDISIPRIVRQKIAEDIAVSVTATLSP